jgi:hypothetical protein
MTQDHAYARQEWGSTMEEQSEVEQALASFLYREWDVQSGYAEPFRITPAVREGLELVFGEAAPDLRAIAEDLPDEVETPDELLELLRAVPTRSNAWTLRLLRRLPARPAPMPGGEHLSDVGEACLVADEPEPPPAVVVLPPTSLPPKTTLAAETAAGEVQVVPVAEPPPNVPLALPTARPPSWTRRVVGLIAPHVTALVCGAACGALIGAGLGLPDLALGLANSAVIPAGASVGALIGGVSGLIGSLPTRLLTRAKEPKP